MSTSAGLMTFAEFERLPDIAGTRELLRGEVIDLPPAKKKHNEISERFYAALLRAADRLHRERPGIPLGKVHIGMGYRMGSDPASWLIPDVSVTHPGQAGDDYYEGAPVLAIGVVSESNTAEHMDTKVKEYLAHGGVEVWIAYPKTESVWVCREAAAQVFQGQLESTLFLSISFDLASLFGG